MAIKIMNDGGIWDIESNRLYAIQGILSDFIESDSSKCSYNCTAYKLIHKINAIANAESLNEHD